MASERVVSDQSGYHPTERSWPRDESWKWSQNGVTVAEQVKSGETTTVDPHKEAMPGKRASVCVCQQSTSQLLSCSTPSYSLTAGI